MTTALTLRQRLALCWRILSEKPGNLTTHALRELPADESDKVNAMMNQNLLELVHVFSTQGHSGFSAGYATSALEKLLRYEPLGPLTGEPDEWDEISTGVFQNRRCNRVFKDVDRFDGQAYDIDGRVFRKPNGMYYTNAESHVPIAFPYTPKTEYVDRES